MRNKEYPLFAFPMRHVPYYVERKLEEEEEYTEEIKTDMEQGLGVPSKSLFIEVFDAGTEDAYAEVIIFDGINTSEKIPLSKWFSINYERWDGVHAEWVRLKAKVSWIKYRLHAAPGSSIVCTLYQEGV